MSQINSKRTIEMIETDKLIPYARNSRTHSTQQVSQLAASIREFGFTSPVLVDKDSTIIAGHGRILAAQQLGMDKVPAIRLDYLTDQQRRAYIIADNKLALNAGWDDEMLKIELEDLMANSDFDVSNIVGFAEDEINQLLNGWNADIGAIDRVTSDDDTLRSTIKVLCEIEARERVIEVIQVALHEAGIIDVTVDG